MQGRICLVTGANRGIGRVVAEGLARSGATVVLVCRDRERGERAREEIARAVGNAALELLLADFASLESLRALAARFAERHDRLHVLVNNAGVHCRRRTVTADGFETTFAVNHLAPFLLTELLLPRLRAGAPSRIVNVASEAHRRCRDLEDQESEAGAGGGWGGGGGYRGFRVYCKSKLANVLFTYELARRLADSGVTANCLHPGVVRTQLLRSIVGGNPLLRPLQFLLRPFTVSPREGADTVLFLATSRDVEGITGKYFIKRIPVRSSEASYDEMAAYRLWELSSRLTGVTSGN